MITDGEQEVSQFGRIACTTSNTEPMVAQPPFEVASQTDNAADTGDTVRYKVYADNTRLAMRTHTT